MDMATAQQRTMKDFLELYNKLVYHCFDKCVSNFNHAKTQPEELSCVTACTDKCILFNQRHMMVFVEHQNAKQKMAAQAAADSQAAMAAGADQAKRQLTEATSTPSTQTEASTTQTAGLEQAVGDGDGQNASPKTVSWDLQVPIVPRLATLQSWDFSAYPGKSIVEQFLNSDTEKLKFV